MGIYSKPMASHGDPIFQELLKQIQKAFNDAKQMRVADYNTASFATVNKDIKPRLRTITINDIDASGLLFFANNQSGKAQDIRENPHVGLCFYWPELKLQVLLHGQIEETSREEAAQWWTKRDRNFQLTAWLSDKKASKDTKDTESIQRKRSAIQQSFADERIPIPEHWSAYRIVPEQVEFWRANWKTASERFSYQLEDGQWTKTVYIS